MNDEIYEPTVATTAEDREQVRRWLYPGCSFSDERAYGFVHKRVEEVAAELGQMRQRAAGASREDVDRAIGEVLFRNSSFPEAIQSRVLGVDMAPLREKLVDAVLAIRPQSPPPPRVNTFDELDALPDNTLIRDSMGDHGIVFGDRVVYPETKPLLTAFVAKHYLPATVMFVPSEVLR